MSYDNYRNGPYIGPWGRHYENGFDLLNPKQRQKEQYCIHNFNDTAEDIQQIALEEYGPDHPQAQGEFCWPLRP